MSSATLSEPREAAATPPPPPGAAASPLRPGHFFAAATLAVAAASAIVLRGGPAVEIGLILFTVAGAGAAAFALYRMLIPFAAPEAPETPSLAAGRARAALERDKALTLRSLKELEFDRAMGKVEDADYTEMRGRLRARAVRLIQQLEGHAMYRERIERDLRERAASAGDIDPTPSPTCAQCRTINETDARFCKMCGQALRG